MTPLVSVQNCTGFSCAAKDDILRIEVSTPNYFYELNTILVGGVEDVGVPSLEQLQNSELNSLVSHTATLDFTFGIAPDTLTPGSTTVNFSGAASVVPLPASAQLLGLAVGMLGWSARRKRRALPASNSTKRAADSECRTDARKRQCGIGREGWNHPPVPHRSESKRMPL